MISLLIVSHSAMAAAGARDLAAEMGGGRVPIAIAGGTAEGGIGTSTDKIAGALAGLPSGDGVLVLVDLGSAVMSAEIALEASGVRYCISNAPLIEGAIFAAASAAAGASLEKVAAEAERSRTMLKVPHE
jgi:phosphocarrier protein FPr